VETQHWPVKSWVSATLQPSLCGLADMGGFMRRGVAVKDVGIARGVVGDSFWANRQLPKDVEKFKNSRIKGASVSFMFLRKELHESMAWKK
jgi:hypothetical protein